MKCSTCYSENPPWAAVCAVCGGKVLPLEFCLNGHLLPPGVRECPVCPNEWPEVPGYAGPPVLRGVLWVERGAVVARDAEGETELPYVEVRDREAPVALSTDARGRARLTDEQDAAAVVRILMRPEGLMVCKKAAPGVLRAEAGPLRFEALAAEHSLDVGNARLRYLAWPVPQWVDAPA